MVENKVETNNKTVLKSAVWYIFSNFFLKGITFITLPIFARLLSKSEFGQFNNYFSWLQILTIFVTLNVQASLISAKYDFKEKFEEFTLTIFALGAISVASWAAILNIFGDFFVNFFNLYIGYINCMIIYMFFNLAISVFQLKTRLSFKYKSNVAISILTAVGTEVLSIIFVLIMADKLQGRILGSVIPTIMIGFFLIIDFIRKGKRVNVSYWKYALKVCTPYMLHTMSLVILSSMDKVMINKRCGNEETAIYSVANNCAMLILLFVNALNSAFVPWLGDMLAEEKYEDIKQVSKKYVGIFLCLAFGMILIIPEILLIAGGKDYMEAMFVLAPLALSCIYEFLYKLFVNVEQLKKKTLPMAFASLTAAVLNYVLNLIFIDKFGYIAAAYTTAISFLWLLIIHMITVKNIGYSKVYDYHFISSIVMFSVMFTVLSHFSYMNTALRLCLIGLYAILLICIVYKKKNEILEIKDKLKREKKEVKVNNISNKLIIIGAGGFAKSIVDSIDYSKYELAGFIDEMTETEEYLGKNILGHSLEEIENKESFVYFIAIGDNQKRKCWYDKLISNELKLINIIDKTANVSPNTVFGNGCFVGKFAVVNNKAILGDNVIVNTRALVEHGCRVESHCNISTNAVINGDVEVGEGSFIGSSSVTLGQINIGSWATVGAGAVVIRDVENNATVAGVPARKINKSEIVANKKIFIVAEIGCNHNGDPKLAKKMVDLAKECGVDAVKFQTFNSGLLISKYADKAEYQKKTTGTDESQLEMTRKLELTHQDYIELNRYAKSIGLEVFSTPFDFESIDFLEKNGENIWKIPSGEITNLPYLEKIGLVEVPNKLIILSTGMSTIAEIRSAIEILQSKKKNRIVILHCNTEYPTPDEDVNISAIQDLKKNFPDYEIGFSDHSVGCVGAVMAVSYGITFIEKHFTLDKNFPGPDHKASATPEELKELVEKVRCAEKMFGVGKKIVTNSEEKNKKIARKSIVAKTNIKKGEIFSEENLTCKRPGNGISPMYWYEILGKQAEQDFGEDELIKSSLFDWEEDKFVESNVTGKLRKIAIIPARSGSKGLPNKNILNLCGKPCIAWTIEAAVKSKQFDRVIVSTDSKEYGQISKEYGAEVVYRSKETSTDAASTYDVLKELFDQVDVKKYDYFALLQPTSPLRTEKHISEALELFEKNYEAKNTLVSVQCARQTSNLIKPVADDLSLENFDLDYSNYAKQKYKEYETNGAIFLAKFEHYLNEKHFFGKRGIAYIMDRESSVEIDDKIDFELAITLLNKRLNKQKIKDITLNRINEKSDIFEKIKIDNKTISFIGHSLLDNWEIESLAGYKVLNFGIRGISSFQYNEQILQENKLKCGSDIYVVMHGTNDIVYDYSNEEIADSILNTIKYIKGQRENAKILFLSCSHVNGRIDRNNVRIDELNDYLYSKLSGDVIWVDTKFLDDEFGNLNRDYTTDGLHFNEAGYIALKNKLEEILR